MSFFMFLTWWHRAPCADSLHCFSFLFFWDENVHIPQVLWDVEWSIFIHLFILQEVCSTSTWMSANRVNVQRSLFCALPFLFFLCFILASSYLFLFKYSFAQWWKVFERRNQLRNNQALKMLLLFFGCLFFVWALFLPWQAGSGPCYQ